MSLDSMLYEVEAFREEMEDYVDEMESRNGLSLSTPEGRAQVRGGARSLLDPSLVHRHDRILEIVLHHYPRAQGRVRGRDGLRWFLDRGVSEDSRERHGGLAGRVDSTGSAVSPGRRSVDPHVRGGSAHRTERPT